MAVRFSIRDLFWAVTLIAAGLGCIMLWIRQHPVQSDSILRIVGSPGIGIVLVSTGLFAPFQQKAAGAFMGLMVVILLLLVRHS